MTEEHITTTNIQDGQTQTHTTVVRDGGGSGNTWLIALLALVAIGLAIWAFSAFGTAEVAKDNAVAGAAEEVGQAAEQIGDAAQEVGEAVP